MIGIVVTSSMVIMIYIGIDKTIFVYGKLSLHQIYLNIKLHIIFQYIVTYTFGLKV